MTDKFPRETAVHEAGHAIVAYRLGLIVGDVHVNADDASGGAEVACADRLSFIDQLAICFAGRVAEGLLEVRAHPNAAACDHIRVRNLLKGISDEDGRRLRDSGWNRAAELLEPEKVAIGRVAEWLVENGRMSGAAFKRLMEEA
jgi:hypothetical protein